MYNVGTWYNNINSSSFLTPLTVSKSVKESKEWQMSILDDFERVGVDQLGDNQRFMDYYRMVDGDLSHQELSEVIPELGNVQDLLDGVGIPTFLKHYDLIGIIVNVLVGNYIEMQDLFHVQDTGEVASNELLREKTAMLQSFIKEKIDAEIELHLIKMGIDPKRTEFQSEEEKQAYVQQLQQIVNEKTPKHIESDLKKNFKTIGVKWGEATLEQDRERFQLDKLEREEFKDFLLTGRCFRHYRVGYDYYKPERWSPINTFFSQTVDSEYAQDGQYVGRIHFYTPSEAINKYGHLIPTNIQKKLLGGKEDWKSFLGSGYTDGSITNAIQQNFSKSVVAPHANYFDYNFALNIQDHFGIPMGNYEDLKTGENRERFLSRRIGNVGRGNMDYINSLRTDLKITTDICQATEVYFVAYDLIGFLSFTDEETGETFNEIVTEDLITDLLKDRKVKTIRTARLADINDDYEPNTLKWFYRPVVYEGLKLSSFNLDEAVYHCKMLDNQIRGDSNIYDVKLPVGGLIGKSLAKKISPYQTQFNLCMNQIFSLLEKEIGTFFLMDVAFIPSEYKDWGDTEEALVHLRNIAKDIGVMPIATSGDAQSNQTVFNQFSTQSITFTAQIASRQQLAEYFKGKAYEVIGITPQQVGAPNKYTNEEGIKVSQNASMAQTAQVYEDFSSYNQKVLELHLAVAQHAQGEGKDISVMYTKSDSSLAYLKFSDENFPFRKIGLISSEDNKKRKKLEQLRTHILNNNTLGTDTLELAELLGSTSYSTLVEVARINRIRKEELDAQNKQHEQGLVQQKVEADKELAIAQYQMEEASKDKDRDVKIRVAELTAAGRATDRQAGTEELTYLSKIADRAVQSNAIDSKEKQAAAELNLADRKMTQEMKLKMEELKLKARALDEKAKDRRSKEFTSVINKN